MSGTTLQNIDFDGTNLDAELFLYKVFQCLSGTAQLRMTELVSGSIGSRDVVTVLVADTFRDSDDDILVFLYHFL